MAKRVRRQGAQACFKCASRCDAGMTECRLGGLIAVTGPRWRSGRLCLKA